MPKFCIVYRGEHRNALREKRALVGWRPTETERQLRRPSTRGP